MQLPQRSACGSSGGDVERGVDLAQEQPRAMRARDEIGVLALPAEPGALRQRLFHHRRGIDEHFHRGAEARDDELCEMLQHALHHVVIVAVAGIDGDVAAIGERESGERVVIRRVGQAQARSRCAPRATAPADGCAASVALASQPMSPCCPAARNSVSRRARSPAQFGAGRSRRRRSRAPAHGRGSALLGQLCELPQPRPR